MVAIKQIDQIRRDEIINYCDEHGECSSCGNCCSNSLPLTKIEIKTIKKYIRTRRLRAERHVSVPAATDAIDWLCPFRDELNKKVQYIRGATRNLQIL